MYFENFSKISKISTLSIGIFGWKFKIWGKIRGRNIFSLFFSYMCVWRLVKMLKYWKKNLVVALVLARHRKQLWAINYFEINLRSINWLKKKNSENTNISKYSFLQCALEIAKTMTKNYQILPKIKIWIQTEKMGSTNLSGNKKNDYLKLIE